MIKLKLLKLKFLSVDIFKLSVAIKYCLLLMNMYYLFIWEAKKLLLSSDSLPKCVQQLEWLN